MKKTIIILVILLASAGCRLFSQSSPEIEVYLITCGPGTEVYSIYGHSALRIINHTANTDLTYNWGVFDFNTKNFVYKFAKGKLRYMLDEDRFDRFLQLYFIEKRWVQSQRINLETDEINQLLLLISENLKPENRSYRYDFYYDDCSTRIRDLLEKCLGDKLVYLPENKVNHRSFRFLTGTYQRSFPWLNFGIDLVIGTPGDKKASSRDKMFLPIEMQKGLSESLINRNSKMIPLLSNPEYLLDFEPPVVKSKFYLSPSFIFSLILIGTIIFLSINRSYKANKITDITIFSVFSLLALLMIFFNFITDHEATKRNLNMLWLSPFLMVCLYSLIFNKKWHVWFKIVFVLSLLSAVIQLILPGSFNTAFIPLILLLMVRSAARAGFSWNPLSVASF